MPAGFTDTDKFSYAAGTARPWHSFGTTVPAGQKAVDVLPQVGLDWEDVLAPMCAQVGDTSVPVKGWFAHSRADTKELLGIVSDGYPSISNRTLAQHADALAEGTGATVETAGSLNGGKRVFFCLRLPEAIGLGLHGCDEVYSYVVVSNGHGGYAAQHNNLTGVRVVCQNTLAMSESTLSTSGVRVYHTGDVTQKMAAAAGVMDLAKKRAKLFFEQCRALAQFDLRPETLTRFLHEAYQITFGAEPKEDGSNLRAQWIARRERLIEDWRARFEGEHQTLPGIQGTAWAGLNAYTEWSDHARTRMNEDSAVFGRGSVLKRRVWNAALQLAGV